MDWVLVIALLAGGYLFWAACKAIKQTFGDANKRINTDVRVLRQMEPYWMSEKNGQRLQQAWDESDPRRK